MPLQDNSIVETVFTWVDGREVAECVVHHYVDEPGTATPPEALGDIVAKLMGFGEDATQYCMCDTTGFVGCSSRILPGFTHSGRIISAFASQNGTVSGENVGAQEAVVMTKYTDTSTRSGRGRVFIPFVPESFVNSGCVTTEAKTTLETYWDKIILDSFSFEGGGTCKPCVYSRALNTKYAVTSAVTRPVTCTQKRRVVRLQTFAPPP